MLRALVTLQPEQDTRRVAEVSMNRGRGEWAAGFR
jgi:hypothetical protein